MELDRGRAVFFPRPGTRRLSRLAGSMARDAQRWVGRADPAGRRSRPLATGCVLRLDGPPGRLDLSVIRALGLGWRMAGATRRQLRARPRLYGWGGQRDSSAGWPDRLGHDLDLGPSAG